MVSEDVAARVVSYMQHQAAKPPAAVAEIVADSQGRLLAIFERCDAATAGRGPGDGEWSLHELLRHVVSAERGVARVIAMLGRGEVPQRESRAGSMADAAPYAGLVDELRVANTAVLDAVRALPDDADLALTYRHPFFGELNCREWAVFQKVHDEDHIQHAGKILAALQ